MRPTPTATFRAAIAAFPIAGWTTVVAAPATTAVHATARGNAARNPSDISNSPSRRTACITATVPAPVTRQSASHRSRWRSSMLAPISNQASMPAATSDGREGQREQHRLATRPEERERRDLQRGHGGQRTRRPAGALEQSERHAVATPAATASEPTWRASRCRSRVPTVPTAISTAVTSSPAPIAPSRRRPIVGSSTCIASPNIVAAATAAAVPTTSRRPASPRRPAAETRPITTTGRTPTSIHSRAPAAPSIHESVRRYRPRCRRALSPPRPTRPPRTPAPARHGISRGHHLPSRRHRPPCRPGGRGGGFPPPGAGRGNVTSRRGGTC